jgi:hypothetical protein
MWWRRFQMAVDKKDLWVQWTRDAMTKYVMPDKVDDADELVDDMADVTVKYADQMLDEFEERFDTGSTRHRRRGAKSDKDEPEED